VAEHISLGHFVAIKTLFGKFVRDEDMRRRFREEAIIQANLRHPHIVSVSDVLDEPPLCAIFMEYIDGSSLDRHIKKLEKPDDIQQSARFFVAVLDAMTYAHAQGVVHRDIKPANILLAQTGAGMTPKVTDFGIAKVLSDHRRTETGTAMGTVYYASPEQLTDAKSVDHRADVYSLGCTFYEMLTHKLPFEDDTMFGVMKKHVQAPRPDPARLNPLIPREISAAIMRAMAVDPKHRFQSCGDFAAEIRRALNIPATATAGGGIPFQPPVRIPATASGAADRPFSVSVPSTGNPVLQRTPNRSQSRTDFGPSSTQVSGHRTTPIAGRSQTNPPADGDYYIEPRTETNALGKTLWVVIGVLAVGLLLVIGSSLRSDSQVIGPGSLIGADSGSDSAATDTGAVESEAPQPDTSVEVAAVPAGLSLPQCNSLADRYVALPSNSSGVEAAISALATSVDGCEAQLTAGADDSSFDSTVGFLTAVQMRAIHERLLAVQSRNEGGDPCGATLGASGHIHRALRRIHTTARDLPPIEARSLTHRRDVLSQVYVALMTDFGDCTIPTVPRDLLSEQAVQELNRVDAERARVERGAAEAAEVALAEESEGSGEPVEEAP
jgi:serine/threonine protein kinase